MRKVAHLTFPFLALIFGLSISARAEIVEHVVVIINNEIITQSDVANFSKKLQKNNFLDELLLFGKTSADLAKSPSEQLNYMINERLLDSEVKRLNLSVTIERVEQEIREIAKRNGINRNELVAAVSQQGISTSEYQDFIKSKVERQSLIEAEITSKIRVSDEDIMAQYSRNNPNLSTGTYEYTIAHILFNPKKGGPEAAEARAASVVRKLQQGESFDVLAEQHSEDPNFSPGGVLGTFKAGEFGKEMEAAVAKINPGETSGVVRSKSGFHVLKLISKKIVSDPAFEKEKEKIRNQLFEKAFQKHFRNWIEAKREESFIRINK
jgi:peptidyl-prolyl cis-trans isomerase SurA